MIRELEDALVAALRDALPELDVQPFPDRPEDYEFLHPVGAALVQYDGGSISAPATLGYVAQARTLTFSVVTITRNLRSNAGCYETLDRVRRCLLGLHLPGCELVHGIDEKFSNETDGCWMYVSRFSVRTTQAQTLENYNSLSQQNQFENPLNAI